MRSFHLPRHAIISAPFTPMDENGDIAPDSVPRMVDFLVANGVKGAFICGSTGEGPSLTLSERKALFSAWGKASPTDFSTIAMTGGSCLPDAKELAHDAQDAGIQAIAIVPPGYFPVGSLESLVGYCQEIAATVPDMPVFYYHIPVLTGVSFSMFAFLQLAETRIPNLIGIKYSHSNLMDFQQCTRFRDGKYIMLWGRDEELLAALSMGADGAVGSTYNYHMPVYQKVLQAFEKGDIHGARFYQEKAIAAIALLHQYGGLSAGKAMMQMIGMDCGPVRSPLSAITPQARELLYEGLVAIGFFDECNAV
ncbi:MAG: dihydrodipicolinate synthase family protein [Bacteroidia bacterium]